MFYKKPASKNSISNRKTKYGVGINDSTYMTQIQVGGRRYSCKAFSAWSNMLKRAYCDKYHDSKPTYKDVQVCSEWLLFSNFEQWYDENYINGYHLDKDIKIKGNRIYHPSTCLFIPPSINTLLSDSGASRGEFPIGVSFDKGYGKYESYVKRNGRKVHIGYFDTPKDAHHAYKVAKNKVIKQAMLDHQELAKYLHLHMYEIQ